MSRTQATLLFIFVLLDFFALNINQEIEQKATDFLENGKVAC